MSNTICEDVQAEVSDVKNSAEHLMDELAKTDCTKARKLATNLADQLSCAETCESMEDLKANLKTAHETAQELRNEVTQALRVANSDADLQEDAETLKEVRGYLKGVLADLSDLQETISLQAD
jgi:ABC-type Zn uptake system ZnuABC Zn-binding protein ZnuA